MLATFGLSLKAVECQEWHPFLPYAECKVNELGAVSVYFGLFPYLVSHALCCLKDCMKVVFLEQFWPAEVRYIGMYSPAGQL